MLKTVLFDLDNTLIDWSRTGPWETEFKRRIDNVHHYVQQHVGPWEGTTAETLRARFIEALEAAWVSGEQSLVPIDHMAVLLETLSACGVPEDCLTRDMLDLAYDWRPHPDMQIYPEVPEVLAELQRHDIDLGIVTNASQSMQLRDRELEQVRIIEFFPKCRISAIDAGYLKPHRRIFELALEMFDVAPDEAVFVGDHLIADVQGAQNAGLRAIWRADAPDAEPPDPAIRPDGIVADLRDMLPLLDAWYPGWRNGDAP